MKRKGRGRRVLGGEFRDAASLVCVLMMRTSDYRKALLAGDHTARARGVTLPPHTHACTALTFPSSAMHALHSHSSGSSFLWSPMHALPRVCSSLSFRIVGTPSSLPFIHSPCVLCWYFTLASLYTPSSFNVGILDPRCTDFILLLLLILFLASSNSLILSQYTSSFLP